MSRTAQHLYDLFKQNNVPAHLNRGAVTVSFPKPSDEIIRSFGVVCENTFGHFIAMAHVTEEMTKEFADAYLNWFKSQPASASASRSVDVSFDHNGKCKKCGQKKDKNRRSGGHLVCPGKDSNAPTTAPPPSASASGSRSHSTKTWKRGDDDKCENCHQKKDKHRNTSSGDNECPKEPKAPTTRSATRAAASASASRSRSAKTWKRDDDDIACDWMIINQKLNKN